MNGMTRMAAAVAMAATITIGSAAGAEELRIGTASQGGAFYPLGQAISNMVSKYVEGTTMVPIVTQGAVQNPRLVDNGEVDLAITNNNLAYFAVKGAAPYKAPLAVAGVAALHPSILHIVTLEGSEVRSFADLKGKRLAVGPAGGGTLNILTALMEAYGMSIGDITPSFLSYADGFSELGDGNVDAALALAGYPTSAVKQTQATHDLQFVTIDPAKLAAVTEQYPYYSAVTVPAEAYGTDDPLTVIGVNNALVVKADMSEDRVFAIAAALFDHMDEFAAENAIARQIDPEQSKKLPIPLHPGAARYFDGR